MDKKDIPEEVKIELTSKCNLECEFCFAKGTDTEISYDSLERLLKDLKKKGVQAIRLTGGEPMLRADLKDILQLARFLGFYIILNTNGTLINEDNIRMLRYVDELLISLNDHTDLDSKKRSILALHEKGFNVRVCSVMTEKNLEHIEKFHKIHSELLDDEIITDGFFLRPAPNPKLPVPLSREGAKRLIERLTELNKDSKNKILIANAIPFCVADKDISEKACKGGKFDSGNTRIVVDSSGDIKTDYYSQEILGNIDKDDPVSIWKAVKTPKLPELCDECSKREICMGGMPNASEDKIDPLLLQD